MSDLEAEIADLRAQRAAASDVEEKQRLGQRLAQLVDRRDAERRAGLSTPTPFTTAAPTAEAPAAGADAPEQQPKKER